MTPVQDFIQSDTVLMRPTNKTSGVSAGYRIKLRFKTDVQNKILWGFWAQNTIKMRREMRQIHWYTAEKEKTNDTKVIKDQTYCIFYN